MTQLDFVQHLKSGTKAGKFIVWRFGPVADLSNAEFHEVRRLLELFPASLLKEHFGNTGDKDQICTTAAERGDVNQIAQFVTRNFGRCKQHAYVVSDSALGVPIQIAFEGADELSRDPEGRTVFLGRISYTVYVREPFEAIPVSFLWPIRIEQRNGYKVVSFVVLERDPRPFANRPVITAVRHVDEKQTVRALNELGFFPRDLNRGVKALWAEDFMDAFRTRFKKPFSTTTEVMDEERGIKQDNPQLYEEVQRLHMFDTLFRVHPSKETSVKHFNINPTSGRFAFTAYSDDVGDTDELVRAILERND